MLTYHASQDFQSLSFSEKTDGINQCYTYSFLYVRDECYCLMTAVTWKQYFWKQFLLWEMISPCTRPQRRNNSFICPKSSWCACKLQLNPGIFQRQMSMPLCAAWGKAKVEIEFRLWRQRQIQPFVIDSTLQQYCKSCHIDFQNNDRLETYAKIRCSIPEI